jgi:hypothetical protein
VSRTTDKLQERTHTKSVLAKAATDTLPSLGATREAGHSTSDAQARLVQVGANEVPERRDRIYTVRDTGDPQYGTGIPRGEDLYESGGGLIVHYFSRDKVEHLARGFDILSIEEFEEGALPRKLFRVTLRKKPV